MEDVLNLKNRSIAEIKGLKRMEKLIFNKIKSIPWLSFKMKANGFMIKYNRDIYDAFFTVSFLNESQTSTNPIYRIGLQPFSENNYRQGFKEIKESSLKNNFELWLNNIDFIENEDFFNPKITDFLETVLDKKNFDYEINVPFEPKALSIYKEKLKNTFAVELKKHEIDESEIIEEIEYSFKDIEQLTIKDIYEKHIKILLIWAGKNPIKIQVFKGVLFNVIANNITNLIEFTVKALQS